MKQIQLPEGNKINIRKARKADAIAILEYIDTICTESDNLTFGKGEFDINIEQEENIIDNASRKNNALYLVAVLENKIIGNLTFSAGKRPRIAHTGELGISVLQEYWGQGIGTEFIKCLIEWCKKSGIIRKINLRVRNDNYKAIHLYKKLGFCEEGIVTRDFLIKGIFYDSILMGLKID